MVKLQKSSPKTFEKGVKKVKSSNKFKKGNPRAEEAVPATNQNAIKSKLKLIGKAIAEPKPVVSLKPTNNVDRKKKTGEVKPKEEQQPATRKGDSNKKAVNLKTLQETNHVSNNVHKKSLKATKLNTNSKQQTKKDTRVKANKREVKRNEDSKPVPQKDGEKLKKKKNSAVSVNGKQSEDVKGKASDEKKVQDKNNKKKPAATEAHIEAAPFEEENFNLVVNVENIKNISRALKSLVESEVNEKKSSIFEDYRYILNVCYYKIPNCPKRMVKLNLAHSLVDPKEDDVVVIVPDLQRGARMDYEPTIQHYEDMFQEHGLTDLKIVPFNQLRQECSTFEAKRKFASTYDHFLCDGRIVGHVVGFCGTSFQRARTTFHAVRLNNEKTVKCSIDKALKRTAFKQLHKGDLISIPVGNHRFTVDHLADNIKLVVDQLKTICPGGLANIRNMHLKIDIRGTSSLPLYASLSAAPAETPNVIGIREQRMLKLKKEANEVLSQFNMSKAGEFVKLDKEQRDRKRKIIEARNALLTEGVPDATDEAKNGEESVPAKKTKKGIKESRKPNKKLETAQEVIEEAVEDDDENDQDEDGESESVGASSDDEDQ